MVQIPSNKLRWAGNPPLENALREAGKKIAPVWPLENFVAVNPYLGLTDREFESAARQLAAIGGVQMTMPLTYYRHKIQTNEITLEDIKLVLDKRPGLALNPLAFLKEIEREEANINTHHGLATALDVMADMYHQDWVRLAINRISGWAAAYFDQGQSLWNTGRQDLGVFRAWKEEAAIDLTPEISGLKIFRTLVKGLPENPWEAAERALAILDINEETLPVYLHRLLLRFGGWSAHAARLDWDSTMQGMEGGALTEFLCVLICWEACAYQSMENAELRRRWSYVRQKLKEENTTQENNRNLEFRLILQEAFDVAAQRQLIVQLNARKPVVVKEKKRPKAQAVFCIDVRSEVFRRNLEQQDSLIDTLGFAGFFAFPIKYVPVAHEQGEAQCPVLIPTGPVILEELRNKEQHEAAYRNRILLGRMDKVWKSFKSSAITCFSFVSPLGLSYLVKLFTDSYQLTRPVPHPDKIGFSKEDTRQKSVSLTRAKHEGLTVGIPLTQRAEMAKNALRAMSLTENFAPFVLIVGHGSSSVNNPHATGLDCGACGGHTGEANARVAAAVLNDNEVRKMLINQGINIPEDTIFLACLHDTTTDSITVYNQYEIPTEQINSWSELEDMLARAGVATRLERARKMNEGADTENDLLQRSKDWSQVRPEWGLAGCSSFIVASRERTRNINLSGQAFLHSYSASNDPDFSILELIMTAPMVVTSWINLQYFASTTDNDQYGAGNKTLHNITAGIGVIEGYAGDLRVGLPFQSVHDGNGYQHQPQRLQVIIEAPVEAMNRILEKHPAVRNLCDNKWIYLLAMNEMGQVAYRYCGNLRWETIGGQKMNQEHKKGFASGNKSVG